MYCTWENTKCGKSKTIISTLKNRPTAEKSNKANILIMRISDHARTKSRIRQKLSVEISYKTWTVEFEDYILDCILANPLFGKWISNISATGVRSCRSSRTISSCTSILDWSE